MSLPPSTLTAIAALAVVLALMLVELRVSRRHERLLRLRGATSPPDAAYALMRLAYPGAFVIMACELAWSGPPGRSTAVAGIAVFAAAKALKAWAITTLGWRWTFRVLIVPGAPLVARGPYRFMRHPNYLAVIGELLGMALFAGALWTGILALLGFGELLRRRILAEERALQLR